MLHEVLFFTPEKFIVWQSFYQHYSFLRFPTLALLMVEALIQRAVTTIRKQAVTIVIDLPVTRLLLKKNLVANDTIEKTMVTAATGPLLRSDFIRVKFAHL